MGLPDMDIRQPLAGLTASAALELNPDIGLTITTIVKRKERKKKPNVEITTSK
jgi:hypothetical protein